MVTRILFDPRRDLATGSTDSSPVTVEATPTGIREDGSVVILPSTLTFTVNTGADQVLLVPPAASWAWRLVVRQNGQVKQQRTVRFADITSVAWADLVDVDPATLGDSPGHARQWDATFFQLIELITDSLAVQMIDNGDGTFTLSGSGVVDNGDGTFTISPPGGISAVLPTAASLAAMYSPLLPAVGLISYNADGTVAADETGTAYAYNGDGTIHSTTKGGVTRTFAYNPDGTIASYA